MFVVDGLFTQVKVCTFGFRLGRSALIYKTRKTNLRVTFLTCLNVHPRLNSLSI